MKKYFGLFKTAGSDFIEDNAPRLGASVAYYTIFSLSPLLILLISLATFIFGAEAAKGAQGHLTEQLSSLIGPKGADMVQSMVSRPENQSHSVMASIIAFVTLLLGSTGAFLELQAALNNIWDVKQAPGGGIGGFIRHRLLSFAMILTIGFMLLVSLVLSTAISSFGGMIGGSKVFMHTLNLVASFAVITAMFALMFKFMPDVRMPWRIVWIGAAFTAFLFVIGKFGLGMYLAKSSASNAFGAAGSLVVLLLWIYYSAQILFFGAELTQAYAKMKNVKVVPKEHAVINTEEAQDNSPTAGQQTGPAKKAPAPKRIVPVQPAPRPGFVAPALLLLLAVFLPKKFHHHG